MEVVTKIVKQPRRTLADLPDWVRAKVCFQDGRIIERWRQGMLVLGEIGGRVQVANVTWLIGSKLPAGIGPRPHEYEVVEVLDQPEEKPKTLADLEPGVLARVSHCGLSSLRWRDQQDFVYGLSCGTKGHPIRHNSDTSPYIVVEVIGSLEMEFKE